MPENAEPRVAVYIDFDNIVISRYDQVFGRGRFIKDRARGYRMGKSAPDVISQQLDTARIDVGAILDYASSFGTLAVTRAYADWTAPANASYQPQLVNRAVDLAQLFSVTAGLKNGADIRLAVDAVEDLFQLEDITHVVVVAGDSDYIALAQRCKRLGRFVVGIGVAGATSRALMAACDEFSDYDQLPGITTPPPTVRTKEVAKPAPDETEEELEAPPQDPQEAATDLLVRALRILRSKEDEEWASPSQVKNQMMRMDPAFKEKPLGFSSFSDFVASRAKAGVELNPGTPANGRRIKLRA